jgi:hypothetical protein
MNNQFSNFESFDTLAADEALLIEQAEAFANLEPIPLDLEATTPQMVSDDEPSDNSTNPDPYAEILKKAKSHARRMAGHMLKQGYEPQALHIYTDTTGKPTYFKARLKNHDEDEKWIRAFHHNGEKFINKEPVFDGGKPLYLLHALATNTEQPVYVCEGEQKADYLHSLGLIATTSGGASSANTTDWQPLAGRSVIVWPDNDEAGQKYLNALAPLLSAIGCTIQAIDPSVLKLPKGGDVINWKEWRESEDLSTTAEDVTALAVFLIELQKNAENAENAGAVHSFTGKTPKVSSPSSPSSPFAEKSTKIDQKIDELQKNAENGVFAKDELQKNDAAFAEIEAAFVAADGGEGDVGVFWEAVVIDAMRHVYDTSQPDWARIRHRLKKVNGLKITDYDRMVTPLSEGKDETNTAAAIVLMANESCTYIHNPDREPYALMTVNDSRQCWHLNSKNFSEWLSYNHFKADGLAPCESALKSAIATMTGKAKYEGEQHPVYTRIAQHDGAYWIDLCNDKWQAVRVCPQGWQVIDHPPVIFSRGENMRPLPTPTTGTGNLDALWPMVNIPEEDRLFVIAWLLECLRPETPFVVLELSGEQGSAKSSTQSALRNLIDPNKSNLRTAPKSKEDIFISAKNSHMVSFENLSHLSADYQDALCSLATGAGYATRTLYTNTEETTIELKKPIILNGISVVVTAQDLLDRAVHLDLPMLETVATGTALDQYWQEHYASVFTGLLDTFSSALAQLERVDLSDEKLPRMADFTLLGEAVYQINGYEQKAFLNEFRERRKDGVNRTLESSPVAMAIKSYLESYPKGYQGTVKNFLELLIQFNDSSEGFPKSPKGLGDAIQRISPSLRQIGIILKKDSKAKKDGFHCLLKNAKNAENAKSAAENAKSAAENAKGELGELGELHSGDFTPNGCTQSAFSAKTESTHADQGEGGNFGQFGQSRRTYRGYELPYSAPEDAPETVANDDDEWGEV